MKGDNQLAPIIIKRKKVSGGDGHHGGAWKVAYADFVTAMMAFFLLMWLLNATTEKQRKGIADYFTPTIALARVSGGGDGPLGGESVFAENVLPRMGTGSTSLRPTADEREKGSFSQGTDEEKDAETAELEQAAEMLMGRGGESMVADELMKHIFTEVTDEGLVVELFGTRTSPLFDEKGEATPLLRELSAVLVQTSKMVKNSVAIEGHTAAYPIVVARNPKWDVSADRADIFRRLMLENGMSERRVSRVTAHADREPKVSNPMDARNNRLEIIFLRSKASRE